MSNNEDSIEMGKLPTEADVFTAATAPEVSQTAYVKRTVGVDEPSAGGGITPTGKNANPISNTGNQTVSMKGKYVLSGFCVTSESGIYLPIVDHGATEEALKKRFVGGEFFAKMPDGGVEACAITDGFPVISKDGARVCRMINGEWCV